MRTKLPLIKDNFVRNNVSRVEFRKYILKSLLKNITFSTSSRIYFIKLFSKFTKFNSISFSRRYCVLSYNSRSVFYKFKLIRHQCKNYASMVFYQVYAKHLFSKINE